MVKSILECGGKRDTALDLNVRHTLGTSDQVDHATSAGGAAEGSQGQARSEAERVAPGIELSRILALKGRKSGALELTSARIFWRPFRAHALLTADPGAARSASLRACPWLPSAAPPALVERST